MSNFDDPNFYLQATSQSTQTKSHQIQLNPNEIDTNVSNVQQLTATYSPSHNIDGFFTTSEPYDGNDYHSPHPNSNQPSPTNQLQSSTKLKSAPSQQSKSTSQQSTQTSSTATTKKPSTKTIQQQLTMLLSSDSGVHDWCLYNNFDPIIESKIGHLNGHDLLTLSKPQLMSLVNSPKHGLLVWTRLKHLSDELSEHADIVSALIAQNVENSKNDKKYNNTQNAQFQLKSPQSGSEVAMAYTNTSNNNTKHSKSPQYSSLLDDTTSPNQNYHYQSSSNSYDSSPHHHNDTNPDNSSHFHYSQPTHSKFNNNNNNNNNNPNSNFTRDNNNTNTYNTYSNDQNDNPYHNYDDDYNTPYSTNHHNHMPNSRLKKIGTGSFDEFFDMENLSLPNIMKYLSWNTFTQSMYTSYNEWYKMMGQMYESRPNIYHEVGLKLKQKELLRGCGGDDDVENNVQYNNNDTNDEYDINNNSTTKNNKKQRNKYNTTINHDENNNYQSQSYQNNSYQQNSYQSYQSNMPNDNDVPPLQLNHDSNYAQHRSHTNRHITSRLNGDNEDNEYNNNNINQHKQQDNDNFYNNPYTTNPNYTQCEFGTCQFYTELKCSQPNCNLALCPKHIVKDLLTGYNYCPSCYQQTYTYSLLNNSVTSYCNIQ